MTYDPGHLELSRTLRVDFVSGVLLHHHQRAVLKFTPPPDLSDQEDHRQGFRRITW
jgi:hypothetical protein